MEVWTQISLEVVASLVGFMAVAFVLLLYVRLRRRRTQTAKELSTEWTPVRCLKYRSLASAPELADRVTRAIPQTTDYSRHHEYPTSISDPWTARTKPRSSSSSSKARDASDFGGSADHVKHRLVTELRETTNTGSGSSLASEDDFSADLEPDLSPDWYGYQDETQGSPPEFLAEEWSMPSRYPAMEFTVMYVLASNTLVVHVVKLLNLFLKDRASESTVVKIKLKNQKVAPQNDHPVTCKRTFDEENGALLTFSVSSCTYLKNFCLLISLYQTKFGKLRTKLLGRVNYSLAQLELCSEVPVRCIEKLILESGTKHEDPLKVKHLNQDHGQLMLSLFYQLEANRMKVLIRKAENLPKKKKILGKQDYYVIVNTFCGGKNVSSQETKSAQGRSPVWNHPMIFDLPFRDLEKYSIQFVVMYGKGTDRDGVVGQVVVGPNVRGTGQSHWKEAICPRSSEAARWHKLQTF